MIVAVTGLATVIGVTAAWDFDEGVAVGLLSGAMTQSAALGTELSAIAGRRRDRTRDANTMTRGFDVVREQARAIAGEGAPR